MFTFALNYLSSYYVKPYGEIGDIQNNIILHKLWKLIHGYNNLRHTAEQLRSLRTYSRFVIYTKALKCSNLNKTCTFAFPFVPQHSKQCAHFVLKELRREPEFATFRRRHLAEQPVKRFQVNLMPISFTLINSLELLNSYKNYKNNLHIYKQQ